MGPLGANRSRHARSGMAHAKARGVGLAVGITGWLKLSVSAPSLGEAAGSRGCGHQAARSGGVRPALSVPWAAVPNVVPASGVMGKAGTTTPSVAC